MVAIVIITIIIIFVIVIKDFTAWLEGYVNRSFYMGKCVPSEQHFFQKEDKQAGFSPYPCVRARRHISQSLDFGIREMGQHVLASKNTMSVTELK